MHQIVQQAPVQPGATGRLGRRKRIAYDCLGSHFEKWQTLGASTFSQPV